MIHTSTPCSDNWISTMYPQKFSIIYVIHRHSCYGQLLITLTVSWRCYEKRHIVNSHGASHGATIDRHDKSICCRSVYCHVVLLSCRSSVVFSICRVVLLSCRSFGCRSYVIDPFEICSLSIIILISWIFESFCLVPMDGWMDELGFYVPSTFQSFRDDGRVNMKGSVQWSAV